MRVLLVLAKFSVDAKPEIYESSIKLRMTIGLLRMTVGLLRMIAGAVKDDGWIAMSKRELVR
jgi:hypothetical protein